MIRWYKEVDNIYEYTAPKNWVQTQLGQKGRVWKVDQLWRNPVIRIILIIRTQNRDNFTFVKVS